MRSASPNGIVQCVTKRDWKDQAAIWISQRFEFGFSVASSFILHKHSGFPGIQYRVFDIHTNRLVGMLKEILPAPGGVQLAQEGVAVGIPSVEICSPPALAVNYPGCRLVSCELAGG